MAEKLARLDDIGGPDSHSNFPHGWAMASNTPLRRYKQNTHGGGIRDPLVISWPNGIAARGELRHQFAHASDLTPTLLDILGIDAARRRSPACRRCRSRARASPPASPIRRRRPARRPQYFEMFGHRGLWHDGWKAVAFHPPGTPFDDDRWELYHLDARLLRDRRPGASRARAAGGHDRRLVGARPSAATCCRWTTASRRASPRTPRGFQGPRKRFVFHAGMGHLPTDVAPDVRSRGYLIEADVDLAAGDEGVLIAHGDATSGYSLYRAGRPAAPHAEHRRPARPRSVSDAAAGRARARLGVDVQRGPDGRTFTLLVDGAAGRGR